MNPFVLLLIAIVSEVIGTSALRASDGFSHIVPVVVVCITYALSFYLMSLCLKVIPLGTAYALWSGLGTIGTVAVGVWLWHEQLDMARVFGIALIVIGVIVLQLFAKQPVV